MDDDDLDSQLLAVTGTKDTSRSRSSSSRGRKKKHDSSDEDQLSDSFEEEFEEKPKKKPLKKRKVDDDELSEEEKFDDGYASDLMGDQKDRDRLESLPEIEREAILAERYQKRQEGMERFKIKQRLQREKDQREGKTSRRTRTPSEKKGGKASALKDIMKKRAKATKAAYSSNSEEEEEYIKDDSDDYEEDEKRKSKKVIVEDIAIKEDEEKPSVQEEPEQNIPVTYHDLRRICLKRDNIAAAIDEPYFDEIAIGCFVRIGIGFNEDRPVYRVAQISSIHDGNKKYKIGKKKTQKVAVLKHAGSSKTFNLDQVSNQTVLESEFRKWCMEMEKANIPLITQGEAKAKLAEIAGSKNYQYSEEQVKKMIEVKKQVKGKPTNYAAERVRLIAERQVFKDQNNAEGYARIQQELDELERNANKSVENYDKTYWINMKNRQANAARTDVSEVRDAFLLEHPELDPFSRRRTRPSNFVFVQPQNDDNPQTMTEQEQKKSQETSKPKKDDGPATLEEAHNFDLPEPYFETSFKNDTNRFQPKPKSDKPKHKRPTISLQEYKNRMEAMNDD